MMFECVEMRKISQQPNGQNIYFSVLAIEMYSMRLFCECD